MGNVQNGAATISGFETLVFASTNSGATQDLSNASGYSRVTVSGSGFGATGLVASPTINLGVLGTSTITDANNFSFALASSSGTSDSVTVNLNASSGVTTGHTLTFNGIETINLQQPTTGTTGTNFALAISDTNTNPVVINVSGGLSTGTPANISILASGLQSNVTTLNATNYTGGITMANTARGSNTNAMSIVGGGANDTIIMTNVNDSLSGGAGVDTLSMSMQLIGGNGYTVVDLSQTTGDQVTSVRGNANSVVQGGFENFDASLSTGNGAFDITARAGVSGVGSVIVGGGNADVITGGTGNDTITGGAGADTIVITSGGVDTINYAAGSTGGFTAAATVSTVGFDVIYGIGTSVATGDRISLAGFGYTANGSVAANTLVPTAANATDSNVAITADNVVTFIRGTYTASANTFVGASGNTGPDSLMVFDTNPATGAQTNLAVVLVGVTGISGFGTAAGIITFT